MKTRGQATLAIAFVLTIAVSACGGSSATADKAPTKTQLRKEVQTEIAYECENFYSGASAPAAGPIEFKKRWRGVGASEESMQAKADKCAAPAIAKEQADSAARLAAAEATRAAAEAARVAAAAEEARVAAAAEAALQASITNAPFVNVDSIVKNPDAVKGQYFQMYVQITQYDAATGACSFRGYWDSNSHSYNFDYNGDNAFFDSGDADTVCPALNGIDQGDTIRVWTQSLGSYSYDTQNGGNTTVPKFNVLRAQVVRKG